MTAATDTVSFKHVDLNDYFNTTHTACGERLHQFGGEDETRVLYCRKCRVMDMQAVNVLQKVLDTIPTDIEWPEYSGIDVTEIPSDEWPPVQDAVRIWGIEYGYFAGDNPDEQTMQQVIILHTSGEMTVHSNKDWSQCQHEDMHDGFCNLFLSSENTCPEHGKAITPYVDDGDDEEDYEGEME